MKHPHADTRLARFIARRIDALKGTKTQAEIAAQARFTNANFLSMLKSGTAAMRNLRLPAQTFSQPRHASGTGQINGPEPPLTEIMQSPCDQIGVHRVAMMPCSAKCARRELIVWLRWRASRSRVW